MTYDTPVQTATTSGGYTTHKCMALGCLNQTTTRKVLFCSKHESMVPYDIQREIWSCQVLGGDASDAIAKAVSEIELRDYS